MAGKHASDCMTHMRTLPLHTIFSVIGFNIIRVYRPLVAGVTEMAKGAGLKIPFLVIRGFESHPPHRLHILKIVHAIIFIHV